MQTNYPQSNTDSLVIIVLIQYRNNQNYILYNRIDEITVIVWLVSLILSNMV